MQKISLDEAWTLREGEKSRPCQVPCSVYDTLIREKVIPDPYWRENEWISTPVSDRDYLFERTFDAPADLLAEDRIQLVFEGIDTLAEIWLNGTLLGATDNMHRVWEYPVKGVLRQEGNLLRLQMRSPSRFVREKYAERPLWCGDCTMEGYPYLRKAHCMFGWDWGPILPDMGIWRSVSLRGFSGGRIQEVYYTQRHEEGRVTLACDVKAETWALGAELLWTVTGPEGEEWTLPLREGKGELTIDHPRLWWMRGLGEQPLYTSRVELRFRGETADTHTRRLGLRTLTISQEADEWGKEFCFLNNGKKVFAMGANYIPEDQIYPRITAERTAKLLQACVDANYNFIRVWGGGSYPAENFYDFCDAHGIIVWQDFMFACSAYLLTPEFEATVRAEIRDNVLRLRNHASLGLWCGNNEIESAWVDWNLPDDPQARADYQTLFERIIPEILSQYDPETFYWPSSPSSGGGFQNPSSNAAGDMHYWAVWHSFKPIEDFRKYYYRFCSEYGFESLPDRKTVLAFAEEKDLDLCGHVMEAHQKCVQGNEKIMYYLAQMVNYPRDFDRLIYCSQLVQSDCIRSNVEHMRRARGRCMGSAYWQVNDSNPVISWSSIDYFGRWKALHYAARRFYAPVLLSCDDTVASRPVLHVSNDTPTEVRGRIVCCLRDPQARVLETWEREIAVPALSSRAGLEVDLSPWVNTREEKRTRYLEYRLLDGDGNLLSQGTTLFIRPKGFDFLPARVKAEIGETEEAFQITLRADAFAKSVRLSLREADAVFSDNWFDLHGEEPASVTLKKEGALADMTPEGLMTQLEIVHYGMA